MRGLIPSIIAPPRRNEINFDERILRLAKVAKPAVILFDESLSEQQLAELKQQFSQNIELSSCRLEYMSNVPSIKTFVKQPASLAFIQFTSGSVLEPRGVMISHENLEANVRGMSLVHNWKNEVFVNWLPLSHDMGLVGHLAASIFCKSDLVLIDSSSFMRRPLKWLRLITDYKGTASGAPNFAYALMNKLPEKHLNGIDLSSWKHAYNGSEPINKSDIDVFLNRFTIYGFKPESLHNVYGMAEMGLCSTFPPMRESCRFVTANTEQLTRNGIFQPAEDGLTLVSVGVPLPEHHLRIVEPNTTTIKNDGNVGEIQLQGASVMVGYLNDSDSSIHDGWLSTGDAGFLWEGELYISGRLKNVIKKAGRNIFANDIESFVLSVNGVRHNGVAAFEYIEDTLPKLGLAIETRFLENELEELLINIQEQIKKTLGVAVDNFFILTIGSLPKTTSGKLQRSKLAVQVENGLLKKWEI